MNKDQHDGIVRVAALSDAQRAAIVDLAALCREHEGLDLPLNLDPSEQVGASDQILSVIGDTIVGCVSLDGDAEIELCGMVHPTQRRCGIGRALLAAALTECRRRAASAMLICDHASAAGSAFAAAVGGVSCGGEHRMLLDVATVRPRLCEGMELRRAGEQDAELFAHMTAMAFEDPPGGVRARVVKWLQQPPQHLYIATLAGVPIASLRASTNVAESRVYICTFGVLPAYRGRGYGRRVLGELIERLQVEGWRDIRIEVATDNHSAIAAYRACGFYAVTTYDFYTIG